MKILMISKALVTGVYQRKVEELAKLPGVELRVIVPPFWREERVGDLQLERRFVDGYELTVEPMRFNGHHHLHYYPGLRRHIQEFRPDIVHVDEEPYNLVAAHAAYHARQVGAELVFFAWQNLYRRYPPPFRQIEKYVYRSASAGIVGNRDARYVLRQKGYRGPLTVIPQFGVDPAIYQRRDVPPGQQQVIGYIGRLVPEKGIETLIEAVVSLPQRPELWIVGSGDHQPALQDLVSQLGISSQVQFPGPTPAEEVPALLSKMDALVLPSRTRPNWKEQFGRILVEALACEVPVIGSSSGEIPYVIGDGGLVFPEGDADELADRLAKILNDPDYARRLGEAGRKRVLERYTQEQIARQTYDLYHQVLGK